MMRCFHWSNNTLQQGDNALLQSWLQQREGVMWVDIQGDDPQQDKALLSELGCHTLSIQDAQRLRHPPKYEYFDEHDFLLYRDILDVDSNHTIAMGSLACFVQGNLLITYHKSELQSIETTLTDPQLANHFISARQLMCRILCHSANRYTEVLLGIEETLSEMEENMITEGSDELLMQVIGYRSNLRKLRRIFSYHERIFSNLMKHPEWQQGDNDTLRHATQDVYDKVERLYSLSALYYDLCSDLSDGYLSLTSHRLNRTMQILTVITAIFVPLGFLAGVYGMNFDHIPELHYRHGYFVLIGTMAVIAIALLTLFKRKKWL